MRFKTNYIVVLIVLASASAIIYGYSIAEEDAAFANKLIGAGTAGLFLIAMPLFLFKESKGKKMKDYMLTDENIKKMQGKKTEKPDSQ